MPTPTPALIRYPGYKKTVLRETVEIGSDEEFDNFDNVSFDEAGTELSQINLVQNEVRFHAVVSEGHEASTKITKFPVQTGFDISNHAIKQNRRITLEGIFSSTILEGSGPANRLDHKVSGGITKVAFDVLESLVQSAAVCEVITNLGVYKPVIFTKFSTKQESGMVDSIKVIISGEEIQVAENVAKASPKALVFTEVPVEERAATITKLTEAGIGGSLDEAGNFLSDITPDTILKKATGFLGEDFSIENLLPTGEIFNTTFITDAWDGVSDYTMSVFTDNTDVFSDITSGLENIIPEGLESLSSSVSSYGQGLISGGSNFIGNITGDLGDAFSSGFDSFTDISGIADGLLNDLNIPLLPNATDLAGAFNGFSNCLLGQGSGVLKTEAEKYIDTALGRLDKGIYGAKMDIIRMTDNKVMQSLIGSGLDCVAAGGSSLFGSGNSTNVDEVVDEMLVGIKGYGDVAINATQGITSDIAKKAIDFIKIESPLQLPLQSEGERN